MKIRFLLFSFILLAIFLIAACGPFHEVTFRVESPPLGLTMAGVSWGYGSTTYLYKIEALPFSETIDLRHVVVSLMADTYLASSGTVTASIFVDGVLLETGTATASGSPASVTISGYVPD